MHTCEEARAYKDAAPEVTLDRILAILGRAGIKVREERVVRNREGLHSLCLRLEGLPYSVWGKGVTSQLARASAHAELLERLQNQALYPCVEFRPDVRSLFGFGLDPHEILARGEKYPPLPEAFRRAYISPPGTNAWDLWEDAKERLRSQGVPAILLPFYDVRDRRVVHLPRNFLFFLNGTNGMAAGNTPHEALVQALSEVAERHILRRLYFEELTPPTIPEDYLRREAPAQYSTIRDLEAGGCLNIVVKDCSLGGALPVVGTITVNRPRGRYRVNLGAHPVWQVALDRCLTETFQGRSTRNPGFSTALANADGGLLRRDYDNFMNIVRTYEGAFPPSLFASESTFEFMGMRPSRGGTQAEMLCELAGRFLGMGHELYVRDVSFLRFNAFQVVIPGVTEIRLLSKRDWKDACLAYFPLSELPRLDSMGTAELSRLADDMESVLADDSAGRDDTFGHYTGLPVKSFLPWREVTIALFVAVLWSRAGDFARAAEWFERSLAPRFWTEPRVDRRKLWAARDCATLAAGRGSLPEPAALAGRWGLEVAEGTLAALSAEGAFSSSLKWFSPGFELPRCWNCESCAAAAGCGYRALEALHTSLKTVMRDNPIDQSQVAALFSVGARHDI